VRAADAAAQLEAAELLNVELLNVERYAAPRSTQRMRLSIPLLILLLDSCAPSLIIEPQRLFLSASWSSGGPAPVICASEFFDRGLLTYSCGGVLYTTKVSAATVDRLRAILDSQEWDSLGTSAARDERSSPCFDCEEFAFYYRCGGHECSFRVPVDRAPEELVKYLKSIDGIVATALGRRYSEPLEGKAR